MNRPARVFIFLALVTFIASCTPWMRAPVLKDGTNTSEENGSDISSITEEMGGSNYVFVDLGRYAANPTDENWRADVKTPVTHYREYQSQVREHLRLMRSSGQKKISLVVWFGGPGQTCEIFAHTVCPQAGKLPASVKANIRDLLADIIARGFTEVQIRMGGQGLADVPSWSQFEESYYQNNETFIFDVIDTSEAAVQGKRIRVFYDLGLELMGHPYVVDRPWLNQYLRRLWAAYLAKYPLEKTVGFSFNHAHRDGTYESLKIFDDSGSRPPRLAFDIYADRETHFQNIQWILILREWGADYPIFVQETYRNDPGVAQDILNAKKNLGLRIMTVMQWPLDAGASTPHANSVDLPFDRYR